MKLSNAPRRIWEIVREAWFIWHGEFIGLKSSTLVRSYLRIQMRMILAKFSPKVSRKAVRILHFNVHCVALRFLEHLFREVFVTQEYYCHLDTPSPLIIDCGSNIGMSVLYFKSLYPQSRIIAFEPAKETFEVLKTNVECNRLEGIELHCNALSDEAGPMDFFSQESGGVVASLSSVRGENRHGTVEAVLLSDFINETVDILKIDIEGEECVVLQELAKTDKLRFVKNILLEYHHNITGQDDFLAETLKVLGENNFTYNIKASFHSSFAIGQTQDILIYLSRKN